MNMNDIRTWPKDLRHLFSPDGIIRLSRKGDSKDSSFGAIYWIQENFDISPYLCPSYVFTENITGLTNDKCQCALSHKKILYAHGAVTSICKKILKAAYHENVFINTTQMPCPYFNTLHICPYRKCPYEHDENVRGAFLKCQALFTIFESSLRNDSRHLNNSSVDLNSQCEEKNDGDFNFPCNAFILFGMKRPFTFPLPVEDY
jgi:hypothetical protein